MPKKSVDSQQSWQSLKPGTLHAVEQLRNQLEVAQDSPQDLIDTYLIAKRALAESMQALLRESLPDSCPTFHDLREQLAGALSERFGGKIPEQYLRVPYSSRTHEELFTILLKSQGSPVPAMMLRIISADSVHTERRMRELRELGLDIVAGKTQGVDVYTLHSLEIDPEPLSSIPKNLIRQDKNLTKAEKEDLISRL
ncbi:hypothetical protein [Streptomyces sp. NRRL S-241]|uniref:hypothetical protein n=1 Tax=Streptomyces sp. NRRL S-241 TaxID=1463896 RepID=UPI00131E2A07|nr:hypothetical protein [Streptomyces sp. NRRL S-241]